MAECGMKEGVGETPTSPEVQDDTDGFLKVFARKNKRLSGEDTPDCGPPSVGSALHDVTDHMFSLSVQPSDTVTHEYDMSKKVGKAFIFVNKHFDERTQLKERKGSENDLTYYYKAFNHLGFTVESHVDKTANFIWETVLKYKSEDHSDDSCVAFAFSTHGDQELLDQKQRVYTPRHSRHSRHSDKERDVMTDVIYAKDEVIFTKWLMDELSDSECPTMAGKPKLFFIQACRGQMLDEVMTTDGENYVVQKPHSDPGPCRVTDVPLKKDFLIAYSAPPGYYSFRRSAAKTGDVGSWFVIALHEVIMNYGFAMDLQDLLTLVTDKVAHDPLYKAKVADAFYKGRRVVPYVSSMLLKTLQFRKR